MEDGAIMVEMESGKWKGGERLSNGSGVENQARDETR